jgi:DegV family protein with EDD domain
MKAKKYRLVTDSHSDILPGQYDIDIIAMPYLCNGEEYSKVFFTEEESCKFYAEMQNGGVYTTAALPVTFYMDYFEKYFKVGLDIIYIHLSSKMTSTIVNAKCAARQLKKKYPNNTIYFLDSQAVTTQMREVVLKMYRLSKKYKNAIDLVKVFYKERITSQFRTYFTVENLSYFSRGGRVSKLAANFSKGFGIYPLMTFKNGEIVVIKKTLGRRRIIKEIYSKFLEEGYFFSKPVIPYSWDISNFNLLDMNKAATLIPINPTTGVHCGPGTIGLTYKIKENQRES